MRRPPAKPGSLVTRREIERMTGLSRQRVHQLTELESFPRCEDDGDDHRHPIWRRRKVAEWLRENDYKIVYLPESY